MITSNSSIQQIQTLVKGNQRQMKSTFNKSPENRGIDHIVDRVKYDRDSRFLVELGQYSITINRPHQSPHTTHDFGLPSTPTIQHSI